MTDATHTPPHTDDIETAVPEAEVVEGDHHEHAIMNRRLDEDLV